jgi:hypothetical protein
MAAPESGLARPAHGSVRSSWSVACPRFGEEQLEVLQLSRSRHATHIAVVITEGSARR